MRVGCNFAKRELGEKGGLCRRLYQFLLYIKSYSLSAPTNTLNSKQHASSVSVNIRVRSIITMKSWKFVRKYSWIYNYRSTTFLRCDEYQP